jgi:hypothetical protein
MDETIPKSAMEITSILSGLIDGSIDFIDNYAVCTGKYLISLEHISRSSKEPPVFDIFRRYVN